MSGGKITVPLVMRAPVGATGRGTQHAQNLEPFFTCIPGIKVVAPATAYDAKGLLRSAVEDDNPVMMFEHKLLYGSKGARAEKGAFNASSEIPDEEYKVPIGKAIVRREGSDITLIGTLLMMHRCLQATGELEKKGIHAEVIDPRTLVPFDWDLVKKSVVEESPKYGGIFAEIAATMAEEMAEILLAPVRRIGAPSTPAPFVPVMEDFYKPSVEKIIGVVKESVAY
jgi:pyruvate dehydrogenase E1 component beta subunit